MAVLGFFLKSENTWKTWKHSKFTMFLQFLRNLKSHCKFTVFSMFSMISWTSPDGRSGILLKIMETMEGRDTKQIYNVVAFFRKPEKHCKFTNGSLDF